MNKALKNLVLCLGFMFLAAACNPAAPLPTAAPTTSDSSSSALEITNPATTTTTTSAAPAPKAVAQTQTGYSYSHTLQIVSKTLMVELATTAQQQQQGLSDITSMGQNQGMLFEFGSMPIVPAFWMKDMNFNLDFIWIANGKVIGVTYNAPAPDKGAADNSLPNYYPPAPVNWVVEVNAGWTEKNNIMVGDDVLLEN